MTAPTTRATPKIALDQRATSRHDNAARCGAAIPEAHRLGVSEAFMHRVRIPGAELAQPKAVGYEGRERSGLLRHVRSA